MKLMSRAQVSAMPISSESFDASLLIALCISRRVGGPSQYLSYGALTKGLSMRLPIFHHPVFTQKRKRGDACISVMLHGGGAHAKVRLHFLLYGANGLNTHDAYTLFGLFKVHSDGVTECLGLLVESLWHFLRAVVAIDDFIPRLHDFPHRRLDTAHNHPLSRQQNDADIGVLTILGGADEPRALVARRPVFQQFDVRVVRDDHDQNAIHKGLHGLIGGLGVLLGGFCLYCGCFRGLRQVVLAMICDRKAYFHGLLKSHRGQVRKTITILTKKVILVVFCLI